MCSVICMLFVFNFVPLLKQQFMVHGIKILIVHVSWTCFYELSWSVFVLLDRTSSGNADDKHFFTVDSLIILITMTLSWNQKKDKNMQKYNVLPLEMCATRHITNMHAIIGFEYPTCNKNLIRLIIQKTNMELKSESEYTKPNILQGPLRRYSWKLLWRIRIKYHGSLNFFYVDLFCECGCNKYSNKDSLRVGNQTN